jgi:hypothetical protein
VDLLADRGRDSGTPTAGGWGAKAIRRLARDLHREFPDLKGFSPRNLHSMRAFAQQWSDEPIVQQLAAQ